MPKANPLVRLRADLFSFGLHRIQQVATGSDAGNLRDMSV